MQDHDSKEPGPVVLVQLALFPTDKRCCHCKATKPLMEFGRSRHERDGLNRQCKECVRAGSRESYRRHHPDAVAPALMPQERRALREQGLKWCPGCAEPLALSAFGSWTYGKDGRNSYCRACVGRLNRAKYYADVERSRAQARAYYERDPEKYRQRKRRDYARRPDVLRLRNITQYLKNRGKRVAYARRYRVTHNEAFKACVRAWCKRHPLQVRARNQARAARKKAAPGRWTAHDVRVIYAAQRGRCAYCQCSLEAGFDVEHMTPITRGGTNWPCNLALSCDPCNSRKHTLCAGAFLALLIKETRYRQLAQAAV